MALIAFTSNHTDHSNDNGYQFEFHCDKCGNGYMTPFKTSKLGVADKILKTAGSFFGGLFDKAAQVGDHVKDSMRGKARDEAFAEAVAEGKKHFKQCSRCGKWVCPEVCWNAARNLCETCAPDLLEEAAAAQAQAAKEQVNEKARAVDQTGGLNMSKQVTAGPACPHCGAAAGGGKFCESCGKPLAAKEKFCGGCGAKLQPQAKFCPECGKPSGS